jgi:hypothetical protein
MAKWLGLCVAAILVLGFAGCENTGGKVSVSGDVRLQGRPVEKGTIEFFVPEAAQPAATASVEKGKYSLPAMQGLLPGKYLVKINAWEAFEITPEEYAKGKKAPPPKNLIPAKYNNESKEIVEVQKAGANRFDFKIE